MVVYLLRIIGTDYHKVGISSDAHRRLGDIQSGMPMSVELLRSFDQEDAREVERLIHQMLDKYRIRGEWFQVESEVAVQVFLAGNTMGMVDAALDEADPAEEDYSLSGAGPAEIPDLFPKLPALNDRIIDWLWDNPWQPSSRIAEAVNTNARVVQTKIIVLVRNNQLYRRPAQNGDHADRYEYAVVAQVLESSVNAKPSTAYDGESAA